jgi:hypothetical protein
MNFLQKNFSKTSEIKFAVGVKRMGRVFVEFIQMSRHVGPSGAVLAMRLPSLVSYVRLFLF